MVGKLYEVILSGVGKAIQPVLRGGYFCAALRVVGDQLLYAPVEILAGEPAHAGGGHVDLMKGYRGGYEQLLVQSTHFGIGLLGVVRGVLNYDGGELHELIGEGEQHEGGNYLEKRCEVSYAAAVHGLVPYTVQRPGVMQQGYGYHKQHRADAVEYYVRHAGTLGVLACAYGADYGGGYAGAEVYAHYKRVNGLKGEGAGRGQCLHYTYHGGGALHDKGGYKAGQYAEDRYIGELLQNVGEHLGAGQGRYRLSHAHKAGEQYAEAHEHHAEALGFLLFYELEEYYAAKHGERSQRGGLEYLEECRAA